LETKRNCKQGVRTLKAHPTEDINATYLFIAPPSLSTLRHRLTSRNTESEDHIKARLETALAEIEYVRDPNTKLDAVIVNDELDRAYAKLRDVALGKSVESDALPRFDD
jgi:guanylate kinase